MRVHVEYMRAFGTYPAIVGGDEDWQIPFASHYLLFQPMHHFPCHLHRHSHMTTVHIYISAHMHFRLIFGKQAHLQGFGPVV